MKTLKILILLCIGVICNFCEKDFISINRHTWRCKSRISRNEGDHYGDVRREAIEVLPVENINVISNSNELKCSCGKKCKGLRGLRSHQRSCKAIKGLNDDEVNDNELDYTNESDDAIESITENITEEVPFLKSGVKLPSNEAQWKEANDYFKAYLPCCEVSRNPLDNVITNFNSVVYNYFKDSFGTVKDNQKVDQKLRENYNTFSKSQLKRELTKLKRLGNDANAIRYVSRLLRQKISNKEASILSGTDHNYEVTKNFWSYCKMIFESNQQILPSFDKATCETYFINMFRSLSRFKKFTIPNWIPKFRDPTIDFDLSPPSYHQINKIIQKMKAKGSPCPLDQLSILCFKRCPYLRSYLLALYTEVWNQKYIPKEWRKAITILIHKKDTNSDPANFRPITLEPVALKIFTSLLRNRMYNFLLNNNYIETDIQKGFIPGMSGTFEHIAHLSYVVNQARNKQRSLTVTLVDLRNAFGEVHHNLIDTILEFHHIPLEMRQIVKSLYGDFHTAIATKLYVTHFLKFSKGVLQGDCLSPLLFNLIINSFVQHAKSTDLNQLGYHFIKGLLPRHWYQFADDAAIVTAMESNNQILLNKFSRWCTWCDMLIRVDKCYSFGIRKENNRSQQVKPVLFINNLLVKAIDIGQSFVYLGKHFDFEMKDSEHKNILLNKFKHLMGEIDKLPLHPKHKIQLYQRYVLSKISWHFTVTNISQTWVKQNLDNILSSFIRSWFGIPISGTLDFTTLSKKYFGLNIIMTSSKFIQCQVTFRKNLKNSINPDIQKKFNDTQKEQNIQYDSYCSTREALKAIRKKTATDASAKLTTQKLVMSSIWEFADEKFTKYWYKALDKLPRGIYSFVIRYLNNTLPNASNTFKWKISTSPYCPNCNLLQSLGHVVSGCSISLNEKRYNWRHDSFLLNLASIIPRNPLTSLYCDIPGFSSPSIVTGERYRPDMIIRKGNILWLIELTIGFETNILKNLQRKREHYRILIDDLKNRYEKVNFVNLSLGACGVFGKDSNLDSLLRDLGLSRQEISYNVSKLSNNCIRTTYYIFCCTNKDWFTPELFS